MGERNEKDALYYSIYKDKHGSPGVTTIVAKCPSLNVEEIDRALAAPSNLDRILYIYIRLCCLFRWLTTL